MLTTRSLAELDGTVYVAEYQTFTNSNATLRIWASEDRGRTWSTRGRPSPRAGTRTEWWPTRPPRALGRLRRHHPAVRDLPLHRRGADVDEAALEPGGGRRRRDRAPEQETSSSARTSATCPSCPRVARLTPTGGYTALARIVGPSYSIQALRGGGFVVGSAHESGGDIYPAGDNNAYLYGSPDGVSWKKLLTYARKQLCRDRAHRRVLPAPVRRARAPAGLRHPGHPGRGTSCFEADCCAAGPPASTPTLGANCPAGNRAQRPRPMHSVNVPASELTEFDLPRVCVITGQTQGSRVPSGEVQLVPALGGRADHRQPARGARSWRRC